MWTSVGRRLWAILRYKWWDVKGWWRNTGWRKATREREEAWDRVCGTSSSCFTTDTASGRYIPYLPADEMVGSDGSIHAPGTLEEYAEQMRRLGMNDRAVALDGMARMAGERIAREFEEKLYERIGIREVNRGAEP